MKIRLQIALLLLGGIVLLGFSSCFQENSAGKPRSSGSASELLIVTDSKATWNGQVGDTIRAWFTQPVIVLPQTEAMFDLINVAAADFGDIFQKFHNILIVEIDPTLQASVSEMMTDTWSYPQLVIKIRVADSASFFQEFRENKASYLYQFNKLEKQRIRVLNQMSGDLALAKKISDRFSLSLDLPGGFYLASDAPNFMWLRHTEVKGKQDVELGIMIYYTDYQDTAQLDEKYILKWRNLITRQHIPGQTDGSYMKVADEIVKPVSSRPSDFPAGYVTETRGLWEVQNDFMGGPFLSYTFVDQKRNRLVTLDGYIYNPNELKRNFMRQLESIFYTVSLAD
jgi:hypothetical protein